MYELNSYFVTQKMLPVYDNEFVWIFVPPHLSNKTYESIYSHFLKFFQTKAILVGPFIRSLNIFQQFRNQSSQIYIFPFDKNHIRFSDVKKTATSFCAILLQSVMET